MVRRLIMKKIHSNLVFFIYFVAITYAFAKDVNILTMVPSYDVEHPIESFLIASANKYGLQPDLIRTYLGSLIAVFIANYLAVLIGEEKNVKLTYMRITPIILLHLYMGFSYITYLGLFKIINHYFLFPLAAILMIPSFVLTAIYANREARESITFKSEFKFDVFHLYWLVFPFYYYMVRIINEWLHAMEMFKYVSTINFFGGIFAVISAISWIVYIIPMYIAIKILQKEYLPGLGSVTRFFINLMIIVLGYLICGSIADGIDWIKDYFKFLY